MTTLSRSVNTGVAVSFRIAFPAANGAIVDSNYVGKIYFDKSLGFLNAQPVPAAQMINEFSINLDGVLFPRTNYTFIRDETGTESAIAFTFPNLYNGNPDDLHEVRATHERGDVSLTDSRLVKAAAGPLQDADGDGLPDIWENEHGLDANNPDGDFGAGGDPDADGLTNLDEFLAGLSPIAPDVAGYPQPRVAPAIDGYTLTFPVITGRRYQMLGSADLVAWQNVGASMIFAAPNPAYEFADASPPANRRFYRLQISVQ
jgi:hypothetical protein